MDLRLHSAVCVTCIVANAPARTAAPVHVLPAAPGCPLRAAAEPAAAARGTAAAA